MDWTALITSLRAADWTLTRIAADTGASVSTISEIAQGRTREPRGELAVRLHGLALREGIWRPEAFDAAGNLKCRHDEPPDKAKAA